MARSTGMNRLWPRHPDAFAERRGLSRRVIVGAALLAAAGGPAMVRAGPAPAEERRPGGKGGRRAVVAFHDGRLRLDDGPGAVAYVPPPGLRSLDALDVEALDRLAYAL